MKKLKDILNEIITESKLLDDIAAKLKTNSVLKQLGIIYPEDVEIEDNYILLRFFPGQENSRGKVNQLQKKFKTVIEKELEKIVGKEYLSMFEVSYSNTSKDQYPIEMYIKDKSSAVKKKSAGTSMIEILANLSTAEIRKVEKSINIEDGSVEGMDRQVNGTIEIAGKEFSWNMDTSDGMSTSYLGDEEDKDNVLHDILIDAVEDAGYALGNDTSDSWDGS
jgi:hypothetical protein